MIVITLAFVAFVAFVAVCHIAAYALARWKDTEIESSNWEKRYNAAERRCAELLSLLDDADADIASVSVECDEIDTYWASLSADHATLQEEYDNLFKSYEALQSELEKVNHNIRKRCPHCNTFMTKDGVCNNDKCKSKKILNATEAAKIIEAGGCVSSIGGNSKVYYSLSARNDGSIGCYRISDMPHNGWCFRNTQEFIDGMKDIKLIQVYPEAIQSKENHVEANKSEKPIGFELM